MLNIAFQYYTAKMNRLSGKVIIVTGAGAGFGRGIVKKLTAEGAKVLAVDMNGETVKETANAAPSGSCVAHTADISSEDSWKGVLKAVLDNFGKLDVCVNCAGVVHNAAPSHTVPEEQFDLMFKVNVKPLYLSNKVITPYWIENRVQGSFINLSSISQPRPRPFLVWYAASKGAVTVVCGLLRTCGTPLTRRIDHAGIGGRICCSWHSLQLHSTRCRRDCHVGLSVTDDGNPADVVQAPQGARRTRYTRGTQESARNGSSGSGVSTRRCRKHGLLSGVG